MANPVLSREFGSMPAFADATLQSAEVPAAAAGEDRMTMSSVLLATFALLVVLGAGAWWGWQNPILVQRWWWISLIGLIVLLVVTVMRPKISPVTGAIYAAGQGAFVGSISRIYAEFFDGIVFLALVATIAVFLTMLALYAFRIVKVTKKVRSVVIIATVGIAIFYLFNLILAQFSDNVPVVFGIGNIAIIVSALVIVVAALNLLLDFEMIERGIAAGAPRYFSWFAAFGLIVTVVWLYLEILRLLAIIAIRRR